MNFQTYLQTVNLRARPLPRAKQVEHGQLGMITEVGELADAFKRDLAYGKPVDTVNVMEECGDILWYFVLFLDQLGLHMRFLDEAKLEVGDHSSSTDSEIARALAGLIGIMGMISVKEFDKGPDEVLSHLREHIVPVILSAITELLRKHGGYTMAECLIRNDAKLEQRTGKAFNAEAILNRDTAAERQVLEG